MASKKDVLIVVRRQRDRTLAELGLSKDRFGRKRCDSDYAIEAALDVPEGLEEALEREFKKAETKVLKSFGVVLKSERNPSECYSTTAGVTYAIQELDRNVGPKNGGGKSFRHLAMEERKKWREDLRAVEEHINFEFEKVEEKLLLQGASGDNVELVENFVAALRQIVDRFNANQ